MKLPPVRSEPDYLAPYDMTLVLTIVLAMFELAVELLSVDTLTAAGALIAGVASWTICACCPGVFLRLTLAALRPLYGGLAASLLMRDKDIAGVIEYMKGEVDHWCVTDLPTPRTASAQSVEAVLRKAGLTDGTDSSVVRFASPARTYQEALKRASAMIGSWFSAVSIR
jgi:hypothetical protein